MRQKFISSQPNLATWTWKDDRHLISSNEDEEWELDGDVPGPVAMMLQLLAYSLLDAGHESGERDVVNRISLSESETSASSSTVSSATTTPTTPASSPMATIPIPRKTRGGVEGGSKIGRAHV